MKFSIIVPVYKVESYIHQCVDSVLNQSFEDFELILVDDASPDSSPLICDDYASKDNRIMVIHKPNGGLSDARNAGLDVVKGEYVLFLDSDDWWDDADALCRINNSLHRTNTDILIFGMKKFYSRENRFGDVRTPKKNDAVSTSSHVLKIQQYMSSNIFVACACDKVVRRNLIEKDHQRFVKGQLSEDIEWCCKLLLKNPRIDVLTESFYVYRQQVSTSITANVGTKNILNILDVITRYAKKDAPEPLLHFIANQFVLLVVNFMRLSKENRAEVVNQIKPFWWLLSYNWYPYVKSVSCIRFFGFNVASMLLRVYYLYQYRLKR